MNVKLLPVGEFAGIEIDGMFLFRDVHLGEKLGLAQPRDIRRGIAKHRLWLEVCGPIHEAYEGPVIGGGGRRGITVYYLSERQALSLCVLKKTGKARALHANIIRFCLERNRCEEVPKTKAPVLASPPVPATVVPVKRGVNHPHALVWQLLTEAMVLRQQKLGRLDEAEAEIADQKSALEAKLAQRRTWN